MSSQSQADSGFSVEISLFQDYRQFTPSTAIYPKHVEHKYLLCGLVAEVGECFGKYAKFLRDGFSYEDFVAQMLLELGDVMWFISQLANYYEVVSIEFDTADGWHRSQKVCPESLLLMMIENANSLLNDHCYDALFHLLTCVFSLIDSYDSSVELVLQMNVDKLLKRQSKGTLSGSGDNR